MSVKFSSSIDQINIFLSHLEGRKDFLFQEITKYLEKHKKLLQNIYKETLRIDDLYTRCLQKNKNRQSECLKDLEILFIELEERHLQAIISARKLSENLEKIILMDDK